MIDRDIGPVVIDNVAISRDAIRAFRYYPDYLKFANRTPLDYFKAWCSVMGLEYTRFIEHIMYELPGAAKDLLRYEDLYKILNKQNDQA